MTNRVVYREWTNSSREGQADERIDRRRKTDAPNTMILIFRSLAVNYFENKQTSDINRLRKRSQLLEKTELTQQ